MSYYRTRSLYIGNDCLGGYLLSIILVQCTREYRINSVDFYVPFHLFLNVLLLHCLEEKEKGEIIDCRLVHLQRERKREREEKRKRERWPICKLIRKCIVMTTKYWLIMANSLYSFRLLIYMILLFCIKS